MNGNVRAAAEAAINALDCADRECGGGYYARARDGLKAALAAPPDAAGPDLERLAAVLDNHDDDEDEFREAFNTPTVKALLALARRGRDAERELAELPTWLPIATLPKATDVYLVLYQNEEIADDFSRSIVTCYDGEPRHVVYYRAVGWSPLPAVPDARALAALILARRVPAAELELADAIKVVSVTPIRDNVCEVVTESVKYGRVVQTVLMMPPSES